MAILRLDHVGIVVNDLTAATTFFGEIGLIVEDQTHVQGAWVDDVVGLDNVHSELVIMETPDGHSGIELTKFHAPADADPATHSPANKLGIRHIAFLLDNLDNTIERLHALGYDPIRSVANFENLFRLCYVTGPEGIIVELSERVPD